VEPRILYARTTDGVSIAFWTAGKKFPFSDRGETALRGFEDRVHTYQVRWR
jgi:hypothetical protein